MKSKSYPKIFEILLKSHPELVSGSQLKENKMLNQVQHDNNDSSNVGRKPSHLNNKIQREKEEMI